MFIPKIERNQVHANRVKNDTSPEFPVFESDPGTVFV
jgi:hypothetical protein